MMTGWYRFCQWPIDFRDNRLATRGNSDEFDATESKRCHYSQFLKCVLLCSWHSGSKRRTKKESDTHIRNLRWNWRRRKHKPIKCSSATCSLNAHATYSPLSHTMPSASRHHWTWFTQSTAIDAYRHIDGIVSGDHGRSEHQIEQQQQQQKKTASSQSRKAFAFTWMKFDLIIHLQCGITFAYI